MKNKIVLLVSMLLPLISGCGETNNDNKKYNYRPTIHDSIDSSWYKSYSEISPLINAWIPLKNLENIYIDDITYIKKSNDNFDYFVCGYMKNEIYNNIIENENGAYPNDSWGIGYSLYKYNKSLYNQEKKNDHIYWYDVKKSSKLPKEIDNHKLICIYDLIKMDVFDISNNYKYSFTLLHELCNRSEYDLDILTENERTNQTLFKNLLDEYFKDGVLCINTKNLIDSNEIILASSFYHYFNCANGISVKQDKEKTYVEFYSNKEYDYLIFGKSVLSNVENEKMSFNNNFYYHINYNGFIEFLKNTLKEMK